MDFPIETERLRLRAWRAQDSAPFAELNADPRVREFFPGLLTREESDASIRRFEQNRARDGYCFWAAELRETSCWVGLVGLQQMSFALPGVAQPAVEIGWRLTPSVWGQGLAAEGARASLRFAFEDLRLSEVVAITVPRNLRSRRVMEKLGMQRDSKDDFENPRIAEGHPLRPHVLYRMNRSSWISI